MNANKATKAIEVVGAVFLYLHTDVCRIMDTEFICALAT